MKLLCTLMICMSAVTAAAGQQVSAPAPQTATITGTVIDVNDETISGATVVLDGPAPSDHRTVMTNDTGFFQLSNLNPGTPYRVTVDAKEFENWTSPAIVLTPGQYLGLQNIRLKLSTVVTTVVAATPEQLATEEVKAAEKQHVLGIIPNFFVVYNSNAVALSPKLKFRLAFKSLANPFTTGAFAATAGIYQAAGFPDYGQGAKGYGQRLGSIFADGYSNIMVGDAILPSLLHQDPRYFYQGTGTTKSRMLHALARSYFTRGDDGREEINYSNIGGDLASGALANAYYPEKNRGPGLVLRSALIGAGVRMGNALLQEFVLAKHTSHGKHQN